VEWRQQSVRHCGHDVRHGIGLDRNANSICQHRAELVKVGRTKSERSLAFNKLDYIL